MDWLTNTPSSTGIRALRTAGRMPTGTKATRTPRRETMIRLLVAILALAALSGCATKEGISLPISKPTQDNVSDFNRRNAPATSTTTPSSPQVKDTVKTSIIPGVSGARLIVVGNAMALTEFDEATLNQRYDNYLKQLAGKPPAFTREWYLATSAGQTSAKYSGVTGIYTRFYRAEIPKDLVRQINFASAFGTFMAGTSADLVAVQVLPGYGAWVTHVLCSEKDPAYLVCEAQYRQGMYQSSDGREVDNTLKLVEGGAIIDPSTFKKSTSVAPPSTATRMAPPTPASVAPSLPSPPAAQQAPSTSTSPSRDEAAQLQKLKELLDKGLITQEENDRKRKEILDRL